MKATTNEAYITKDRGIRTSHNLVEDLGNRFLSNHKGKTDDKKERGPRNLQIIRKQKTLKFGFV